MSISPATIIDSRRRRRPRRPRRPLQPLRLSPVLWLAWLCLLGAYVGWAAPARAASGSVSDQTGTTPSSSTGSGQPGTSAPSSSISATIEQCLTAVAQTDRSATFSGQMNAVAGTQRMAMRIDVQERTPGEAGFRTLEAPGLGVWRRSAAGVKVYKYLRQVVNLPAPADFRAVVHYHWLDADGHVIRRAERHTNTCAQPDERPRLAVSQVTVVPVRGSPLANYEITIHNGGRGPAPAFGVALTINGTQRLLAFPTLTAGNSEQLQTQAPRCVAGSSVEVALDPQHQVEEAVGGGMSDTVPCPSSAFES